VMQPAHQRLPTSAASNRPPSAANMSSMSMPRVWHRPQICSGTRGSYPVGFGERTHG
jgi:hypothetical protein